MKPKIGVIICSVRDGRRGDMVAKWFLRLAQADSRFEVEPIDLKDYDLPLEIDEALPSSREDKKYPKPNVQAWSDLIDGYNGYIFVMPEYNHAVPASLKNAIDQIYYEWLEKPVSFVSYGGKSGAIDAVDSLKHLSKALKWVRIYPEINIVRFKYQFNENGEMIEPSDYVLKSSQMLDDFYRHLA